MSILYKVVSKRPGGIAGKRKAKYYPALTRRHVVDLSIICKNISRVSTLTSTDVKAVIEALIELIPILLAEGKNVRLDDLGTFSVHVSANGHDDPDKVSALDIKKVRMAFLPSKRVKDELKNFEFESEKLYHPTDRTTRRPKNP